MNIAVLITTYNRKEKTLACLHRLKEQTLPNEVVLTVFLTDDASKDGTAEAVAREFPDTKVFSGNGSLFWAGGMRKSWQEAIKTNPDFYLLINDDTVLLEGAIQNLFDTYEASVKKYNKPVICVGSTKNNETGETSYGGQLLISPKKVLSYKVENNQEPVECDMGNANIMLVPKKIMEAVGILSDAYTHGIADYDYTLSAKKKGFPTIVAPGFLGICEDDHGNSWKSQNTKLKDRITYLFSPKGLAYKEYLYFIKKHFPTHYPAALSKLWLKTFFPFLWDTFKK